MKKSVMKPRIMVNKDYPEIEYKVYAHIILRNFWEYYVTKLPDEDGNFEAFVMGFENEHGGVNMTKIKPYIMTVTRNLRQVMPATGFTWK